MAALSGEVEIQFAGNINPDIAQVKGEADTYYRGGLAHHTAGVLNLAPLATEEFAGVVWESSDGAITLNDLIWIAITGRFHFACAEFKDADFMAPFAMPAAGLTDNPADLDASTTGSAGVAGTLDHVTSTAVSGWLNINRRTAPTNE
jgi:hypothetical protein